MRKRSRGNGVTRGVRGQTEVGAVRRRRPTPARDRVHYPTGTSSKEKIGTAFLISSHSSPADRHGSQGYHDGSDPQPQGDTDEALDPEPVPAGLHPVGPFLGEE